MIKKLSMLMLSLGVCTLGYGSDNEEGKFREVDLSAYPKLLPISKISLDCNHHLTNVEFLLSYTSLTNLSLSDCISLGDNYKPISQLTNLETLALFGSEITTTEQLRPLTKLKELIFSCEINIGTSIDHLSHLNLIKLKIFGEPTEELTRLSQLTSLESLNLEGYGSRHDSFPALDFITNLSNLKFLDLTYNAHLSYIEPLTKLTKLTHLNLRGCMYIYDLSSIGEMKNLEYLNLYEINEKSFDPKTDDYSFITKLTKLQTLVIDEGTPESKGEMPTYISSSKFILKRKRDD